MVRRKRWSTVLTSSTLAVLAVGTIEIVQAYTTTPGNNPYPTATHHHHASLISDDTAAALTSKTKGNAGHSGIRGVRQGSFYKSNRLRLLATTASSEEESKKTTKKKKKKKKKVKTKGRKKKKKKTKTKAKPKEKGPATARLARATARAVAIQKQQEEAAAARAEQSQDENEEDDDIEKLGTVWDLFKAIDEQLIANRDMSSSSFDMIGSDDGGFIPQRQVGVGDSMSSLLDYNIMSQNNRQRLERGRADGTINTRDVAVVFGKRLVKDQVTVEYASRIQTLVRMLMSNNNDESSYQPSLICFCSNGPSNHVAVADAGYVYFRHLCACQNVNLDDDIDIFVDGISKDEGEAIERVSQQIKQRLGKWFEVASSSEVEDDMASIAAAAAATASYDNDEDDDEFGDYGLLLSRTPQKKLHVHVTLISTGYHLCNLNDIHTRSPQQSLLRPIEAIGKEYDHRGDLLEEETIESTGSIISATNSGASSFYEIDTYSEDEEADVIFKKQQQQQEEEELVAPTRIEGVVESTWSFRHATYPYTYDEDEEVAFRGKCYLLGQELMPLLVNMKGVVDNVEFFQRDNYLVLASIRRALVSFVEDMYKSRPGLRFMDVDDGIATVSRDPNIVLEGAVLSLGRCIDLVRPAGLLVSTVPKADWIKALGALEHCMTEIQSACDPDQPLPPSEWGKMGSDDEWEDEAEEPGYQNKRFENVKEDDDDEFVVF